MTDLLGPGEAGRRLGVSTRTVQRWLRTGRLPSVRVGARLKVPIAALPSEPPREPADTRPLSPLAPSTRVRSGARPIRRLLVANRGELVVRIARTCRSLGVTTLALVPTDQRDAWWTLAADVIVTLPTGYLDGPAIVDAAVAAGADAVHPGYGFLAERPEFAEAVVAAGLTWVGPPPAAMRALGDKAAARHLAARIGVPILAGYDGSGQS